MFLRTALPGHHLSDESRDVVKLATGLVGTMAALVLGLLVASAKGSFDGTLIATMLISALSASGAILLILEMYTPYGGLIQIPDAPLRAALAQLGQ